MATLWQSLDYLQQGGSITILLILVSLWMWTLIIDKFLAFRELTRADISIPAANCALAEGRPVVGKGLRRRLVDTFLRECSGEADLDREILRQCAAVQQREFDRGLAVIAVLAAIAPLLGLLGTVLGMIETFTVISIFGTGNAGALAGGISTAMITTQSGLLVAIPGLFLSGVLNQRSHQLKNRLAETTTVIERHLRHLPADQEGKQT